MNKQGQVGKMRMTHNRTPSDPGPRKYFPPKESEYFINFFQIISYFILKLNIQSSKCFSGQPKHTTFEICVLRVNTCEVSVYTVRTFMKCMHVCAAEKAY